MADEMDVFFGLDTPEGQAALFREREKLKRELETDAQTRAEILTELIREDAEDGRL